MTRKPAPRALFHAVVISALAMMGVALAKTQAPYLTRLITEGWPSAEQPIGNWRKTNGTDERNGQ